MTVRLHLDVSILLHRHFSVDILDCGNAALLHQRDMLGTQTVVVVLLQKRLNAVCEALSQPLPVIRAIARHDRKRINAIIRRLGVRGEN